MFLDVSNEVLKFLSFEFLHFKGQSWITLVLTVCFSLTCSAIKRRQVMALVSRGAKAVLYRYEFLQLNLLVLGGGWPFSNSFQCFWTNLIEGWGFYYPVMPIFLLTYLKALQISLMRNGWLRIRSISISKPVSEWKYIRTGVTSFSINSWFSTTLTFQQITSCLKWHIPTCISVSFWKAQFKMKINYVKIIFINGVSVNCITVVTPQLLIQTIKFKVFSFFCSWET